MNYIVCNKSFEKKRPRDSGKYCSHECYLKRSGLPLYIFKTCAYCGKEFQARSKFKYKKCCSYKCSSLYGWSLAGHRNLTVTPCLICGNNVSSILSRRKSGKGKYCSRKCYGEAMKQGKYPHSMPEEAKEKLRKQRIGILNPAYIHGHNDNHIRYMAGFTNQLRKRIKQRDLFICQLCGKNKKLDVHHVDSNPMNNDERNLITWCHSCHMRYHKKSRSSS